MATTPSDFGLSEIPAPEPNGNCDCDTLDRWKNYALALGITSTLLAVGCMMMGWALAARSTTVEILEERLQVRPADVLEKLSVTPADVRAELDKINERLDEELKVKPSDVLQEVQSIGQRLEKIEQRLDM